MGLHLPYFDARMRWEVQEGRTRFFSERTHPQAPPGVFEARYQPSFPLPEHPTGSLTHWLTERYCLYSQSPSGQLYRCQIHHQPWPLESARVEVQTNTLGALLGLQLSPAVSNAVQQKAVCGGMESGKGALSGVSGVEI